MKKELLASVLTLSAGMASVVAFPQHSLARAAQIEKSLDKTFKMKSQFKVRHTDENGKIALGHIYLSLEQDSFTPEFNNQLHGEMTGSLVFVSDEAVESFNGKLYKRYVALTGDDGEILLDRIHEGRTNEYQVYGCNSTMTQCEGVSYAVSIAGDKVTMSVKFSADQKLEIYEQYDHYSGWDTSSRDMKMIPVTEI